MKYKVVCKDSIQAQKGKKSVWVKPNQVLEVGEYNAVVLEKLCSDGFLEVVKEKGSKAKKEKARTKAKK